MVFQPKAKLHPFIDVVKRKFPWPILFGGNEVNLTDLFAIRRFNGESIDNYLAGFRNLKNSCYTSLLKAKVVKMALNGLNYSIRKKLINQQFLDLA